MMARRLQPEIPIGLEKVYRRFERWRSSHHRRRLPIPEKLWLAAAETARKKSSRPIRFPVVCFCFGAGEPVTPNFPDACRHVLETLAAVYHHDALAQKHGLSPEERLLLHQQRSGNRRAPRPPRAKTTGRATQHADWDSNLTQTLHNLYSTPE